MFWQLFEWFLSLMQGFIYTWFLHRKFADANIRKWLFPVAVAAFAVLVSVLNGLNTPSILVVGVSIVALLGYSLLLSRSHIWSKAFFSILIVLLSGILDISVAMLLHLTTGASVEALATTNAYRIQGSLLSMSLLLLVAFLLTSRRESGVVKGWIGALLYAIPLLGIAVLFIIFRNQVLTGGGDAVNVLLICSGLLGICVSSIVLYARLASDSEKIFNQEMTLQQMQSQLDYIKEIQRADDEFRGFRHDLSNHIQVLAGLIDSNNNAAALDYIRQTIQFFEKNKVVVASGSPPVDAVIGSKTARARQAGIEVEYDVRLPEETGLQTMELCSILGNLLDNAIESCERMDGEKRTGPVRLTIGHLGNMMSIYLSNPYQGKPIGRGGGGPATLKKGSGHGLGLGNVRRIVHGHGGVLDITGDGDVFVAYILLPIVPHTALVQERMAAAGGEKATGT